MKFIRATVVLFLLLSVAGTYGQSPSFNTLLWRISGNGLQKPSYLFGTLHLRERRLFQFTDSLYGALAKSEGLALEIDLREYLDSSIGRKLRSEEAALIKGDERFTVDRKKLPKDIDSVLSKFGVHDARLSRKQLADIRAYRTKKLTVGEEMPTIIDAYLYGLALRMHKWLGGLEDVQYHLDLVDELGNTIGTDEVFQSDKKLKTQLDEMTSVYIKEDIGKIADFGQRSFSDAMVKKLLTDRNRVMADHMDSLANIRSMFFAIGSAHLGGDSGVIALLRTKGYQVDPVFCEHRTYADLYAKKLDTVAWVKVEDSDKLYTVNMPAKPVFWDAFGGMEKMQTACDLTNLTVYMTGSSLNAFSNADDVAKALEQVIKKVGGLSGRLIKKTVVEKKDLTGLEAIIEGDLGSFRIQILHNKRILVYMIAASEGRINMDGADVNRFFNSLSILAPQAVDRQFTSFDFPAKGFSVSLPGKPVRNSQLDARVASGMWNTSVYNYMDNSRGVVYWVQINDMRTGYSIGNDSAYFAQFRTGTKEQVERVLQNRTMLIQGYPALRFDFLSKQHFNIYTLNVIRGFRMYTLMMLGSSKADFSDTVTFFSSLALGKYALPQWEMHSGGDGGFITTAVAPFAETRTADTANAGTEGQYREFISYDSLEAIGYTVEKSNLSKYYWYKNDSAYFSDIIAQYRNDGDSVSWQRFVQNGGIKGIEALYQLKGGSSCRQIRFLVNSDTLYTLSAYFPLEKVTDGTMQQFFSNFRVSKEVSPTIFVSKSKQLLDALRTADSSGIKGLYRTLVSVSFSREDLPYLHQALITKYHTPAGFEDVNKQIARTIVDLRDSTAVDFVKDRYPRLSPDKDGLKQYLLLVLAEMQTTASYKLLKDLIAPGPGAITGVQTIISPLMDSLELTRSLLPELLHYCSDSGFRQHSVLLIRSMLDSGYLHVVDLEPYRKAYLQQAGQALGRMNVDPDGAWECQRWIPVIARFRNIEAYNMLRAYLKVTPLWIRKEAALALIRNGQPVSKQDLLAIANDRGSRNWLYDQLQSIKKEQLFPVYYANQKWLAESELYNLASDDREVGDINFIGERVYSYKGKNQRFFLFKVHMTGEDQSTYLGITGPYPVQSSRLSAYSDASGLLTDQPYEVSTADEQVKAHLKGIE